MSPEAKVADTLAGALLAAQREMPAVGKDAEGQVGTRKYAYVSLDHLLETVLPIMHRHGLVLIQQPSALNGGQPALTTTILHAATGEKIEAQMPLSLPKDDPQSVGSALTYARRYSLASFLGVAFAKDDDAASAMPRQREERLASDSPMSLRDAVDRLGLYVEDIRPWIRAYSEATYPELADGFPENAKDLPDRVRLNLIGRLINVVAALPPTDGRLEFEQELKAAFAASFDGLVIDVDYKPSIPF